MPSLLERMGSALLRSGIGQSMFREERTRLAQTMNLLERAYFDGPWRRPPEVLASELQELDPWVLADVLNRSGWEVLNYSLGDDQQRERARKESRRLFKYSPVAQWAIWLWTSWGLGDKLTLTINDDRVQGVWDEFWKADRNQPMLGADRIHELSNWLLIDGNTFLTFHASTVDGEVTLGEVDPDNVGKIITLPGSKRHPLFYERTMLEEPYVDAKGRKHRTVYYPDWSPYFEGKLDSTDGGGKTLAQRVLPDDAFRMDLQAMMSEETWRKKNIGRGNGNDAQTVVVVLHVHYNHKERGSLWGWPLLATDSPWLQAHREFLESRLAVAKSKAMYVRRKQVQGGSRGVQRIIDAIDSNLSSESYYDTNPAPPAGSVEVENRAVTTTDLPMTTGAGDAQADNSLFAWHALLGAGLFPASAGLDLQRYATALAMDKSQSMQWTRYQSFWSAQFERMARIVDGFSTRYSTEIGEAVTMADDGEERPEDEELVIDVSVDTFSLSDFPDVSSAISNLAGKMLIPMAQAGVPVETVRRIWASLWRVTLQALGVGEAHDMTSDEAFGAVPEEEAPPEIVPGAAGATGALVATERMIEMLRENTDRDGAVDWQSVASTALDMLSDQLTEGGPGSGHKGHRGIPGYQGGSMAQGPIQFRPAAHKWPTHEDKHIRAYAQQQSEEWLNAADMRDVDAVTAYTGSGYDYLNDCMRHRSDCSASMSVATMGDYGHSGETIEDYCLDLEDALSYSVVPEETIAYRGVSGSVLAQMREGKAYQDNGFMSTSINPNFAAGWKSELVEIRVPKGTQGGYTQKVGLKEECELLLQAGTQVRFTGIKPMTVRKLVGYDSDSNPRYQDVEKTVHMFEVVGQGNPWRGSSGPLWEAASSDQENKFAWEPGDLVPINEDEVVKIGKRQQRERLEAQDIEEGGPDSGHRGHRGIPGYQGGSMASGPIQFLGNNAYSSKHIEAYARLQSEKWIEEMYDEEHEAALTYSGPDYRQINDCARKNHSCNSVVWGYHEDSGEATQKFEARECVHHLEAGISQSLVPEDTVVYRGVSIERLERMKSGDLFQDNGFSSTTLNPATANGWKDVPIQIRVPKGTQAGYMQNVSSHPSEIEVLLQRGTQFSYVATKSVRFKDHKGVERTRDMAIFEVMGQALPPDSVFVESLGSFVILEQEGRDRSRGNREDRFTWDNDDLIEITKDDVVEIGKRPKRERKVDVEEGGSGSGNWGHRGIPGFQGGSLARRHGFGAGQVSREFWTIGSGKKMVEDLDPDVREAVIDAYSHDGIQYRHFNEIRKITDQPPPGRAGWSLDGYECVGIYHHEPYRTIHVKKTPYRYQMRRTAAHELGHHIDDWGSKKTAETIKAGYRRMDSELKGLTNRDKETRLIKLGLTPYNMTKSTEFLAGAFEVFVWGSQFQKKRFAKFLGTSLDDLFRGYSLDSTTNIKRPSAMRFGEVAGDLIPFDPETYDGEPLYVLTGISDGDMIGTVIVADDDVETATAVPWQYMVWTGPGEPEGVVPQSAVMSEGGPGVPGSGHHGHRGQPGHRGGSLAGYAGLSSAFTTAAVNGNITDTDGLGGGICESYIINYEDDGSGVWKETDPVGYTGKWGHDGHSEVAAHRINRLMGGKEVPQTVYGPNADGVPGTSQQFISGGTLGYSVSDQRKMAAVDKAQIDRTVALDIIIGNGDRHDGNYLLKDNNVIAIDHGHAHWGKWEDGPYATTGSRVMTKWLNGNEQLGKTVDGCSIEGGGEWVANFHGKWTFSSDLVSEWSKITRNDFDKAMRGVSESNHVNLDNAWHNLQLIVSEGKVEW